MFTNSHPSTHSKYRFIYNNMCKLRQKIKRDHALHRRDENDDGFEHREFQLIASSRPLAPSSCSCSFPRSTFLEVHRHCKTRWNSSSPTRERHIQARTHARRIVDTAMRRVRGLPRASQLNFCVINDMIIS